MALLLAVCLLAPSLLTGCRRDETVTIGYDLPGTVRTLDPQTANDEASQLVIHSIFEGLFDLGTDGELIPAAVERYSVSADGLTYTFLLREDVNWSYRAEDGSEVQEPVTAADFVFAFRRLFQPGVNPTAASRYRCIRGASAILAGEAAEPEDPEETGDLDETDEPEVPAATEGSEEPELGVYADGTRVLRFELETPNDNFLRLLTATYAMPCNETFFQWTRGRYGLDPTTTLANGPFELYRWEGVEIRLVRNEQYREAGSVRPDVVKLYSGQRSASGAGQEENLRRLTNGTVHAALLDGSIDGLLERGLQTEPVETAVWGLRLNWGSPSLANDAVRQAIALAFDRTSYAARLPQNLGMARAILPHGVLLSEQTFRAAAGEDLVPAYDPAGAYESYKQGLAELGQSSAGELRLIVNKDAGIPALELFAHVSQVLQRELSLYIKVDELSEDAYGARLAAGDFDLAFCSLQAADSTPWAILSQFMSDSVRNYGGYSSAAFDEAMHTADAAGGGAEADAAYQEAERILIADAAFLPMVYSTDYFVTRPNTHGIVYNPWTGMVDFRGATVD